MTKKKKKKKKLKKEGGGRVGETVRKKEKEKERENEKSGKGLSRAPVTHSYSSVRPVCYYSAGTGVDS